MKAIEKAIDFCQDVEKANAAIDLIKKTARNVQLFSEEEKKFSPIFFKEVDFKVRASQGHGHGFSDLSIKKLEIRPNLNNNQSESFCFSLMLVLVAENNETFWFRIARTNNWVRFYLVECRETDTFFIRSADDVCVKFYSSGEFMKTMNFCYDSIDAFNDKLKVKLVEHLIYLCKTPITRKVKEELFPTNYLFTGMRIGIFDASGAKVSSAIISMINDKALDFYPSTKIIELNSLDNYFPDNTSLAFIPNTVGFREGWYVVVNNNYDLDGPIYEIRPA